MPKFRLTEQSVYAETSVSVAFLLEGPARRSEITHDDIGPCKFQSAGFTCTANDGSLDRTNGTPDVLCFA